MALIVTKHLNKLQEACTNLGITCQFGGNNLPKTASSIRFTIDDKNYLVEHCSQLDSGDYVDIIDIITLWGEGELTKKQMLDYIITLQDSLTKLSGHIEEDEDGSVIFKRNYHKDGDRVFRIDMRATLMDAISMKSYDHEIIKSLFTQSNIDCKNYRLIEGDKYITPSALACVLRQTLKRIGKQNKNWLLNQLGLKDNPNAIYKTCEEIATLYIQGNEQEFWSKVDLFQEACMR